MTDRFSTIYERAISDVLACIEEMRQAGGYDENTLETIEWRISPPKEDN